LIKLVLFLYRQKQKWIYHTAKDTFVKVVAEINRLEPIVRLNKSTFIINGCSIKFSRAQHAFVVERLSLFRKLLSYGTIQIVDEKLIYTIDGVNLNITTSEEIFIINEIFIDGCYNVTIRESFNVVDIGMNVGFASLFFASNPKVNKVIGFEPFKSTYADAIFNFSLNHQLKSKISTFNFGLSNEDKSVIIPFSSTLKGKNSSNNEDSVGERIELREASLVFDELINEHKGFPIFVKMDCEGAEFQIFESLILKGVPKEVFGLIIEWHEKPPVAIVQTLLANDFKIHQNGRERIGLIVAFR
jgi:FkbM family methyltransferase